MHGPLLKVTSVTKRYGPIVALKDVSISFNAGEIHAVVGENGAGKSTLMGVLSGFIVPDFGAAKIEGRALHFGRPHEAMATGIKMVHQHFMLVESLSVAENIALATIGSASGRLDLLETMDEVTETARKFGWILDFDARVSSLPVGAKQKIEILKAVHGGAKVLILDEPTAVLSHDETKELFRVLRSLAEHGASIVLIAHKLSEVFQSSDRVSILRHGSLVTTRAIQETSMDEVAKWMVGDTTRVSTPTSHKETRVLLSVEGVHARDERGTRQVRGVDFDVYRGEVLGIGGVEGNGQAELAEVLAGVRRCDSGEIVWIEHGRGVGFIPPDRHQQALALEMSVADNVLIESIDDPAFWSGPLLNRVRHAERVNEVVREFGIKVGLVSDPVASLSGGNQQRIVVGRVLASSPDLIVAHNPTRGLDFKATAHIRASLVGAAQSGAAVVIVSNDREELAETATCTLWMGGGKMYETEKEALVGVAP